MLVDKLPFALSHSATSLLPSALLATLLPATLLLLFRALHAGSVPSALSQVNTLLPALYQVCAGQALLALEVVVVKFM
ncbi:hypothetical protein C8R45DRAFT_1021895 [Mycena sanguinolenta]|nr:hypothetical protein C8R45DRAFT_1021895 [Mycena sanguinolenta]